MKKMLITTIVVLFALSFLSAVGAEETAKVHPEKVITAIHINPHAPVIDGILNDEIWHKAPASGDFCQRNPKEGDKPSEDTKVQIAYDDDAIYIGVACYDKEPNKIVSRLTRRDGWVESDWVSVNIDSYHDHKTGNWFCVNSAGVLNDGQMFNDGWEDSSWNGVWEAKTSIGEEGWYAEYKIPYHVLRFSKKDEYVWGMNVIRGISRRDEKDQWILVGQKDNGWISHFGHIVGIKGINPPNHLEFSPFAVGRSTNSLGKSNDLFSTAGIDMRYGVTSNVSLNATFNPDFGQIEADPAQLNLSTFETYFEEKRPFFIEGNTIFSMPNPEMPGSGGIPGLFYSRRIGRQPEQFAVPDGSEVIDQPKSTTIISAVKLSGKTEHKTAFGIVNAVTANEYAEINRKYIDSAGIEQVRREEFRIEPLTNFFVGRIQQDVFKKSTIGAMMTAVNRDSVSPAYAGDIDAHLKFGKQDYSLYTRLTGSQTGSENDRKNGYDAYAYLYKFSGVFGGQFFVNARSPEFNVNDLGFMDRADIIQSGLHLKAESRNPHWISQHASVNFNAWSSWNYDGINLSKGINFNTWSEFKSQSFIRFYHAGISRDFEAFDDMETRGGPLMIKPSCIWGFGGFGTDGRKIVSFEIFGHGMRTDDGASSNFGGDFKININLASRIQINIGPGYNLDRTFAQWINNVDDNGDGNNDHYVFGELNNKVIDFSTRLNVSFTTSTSLQLYLQPFVAVGNYSNFKELARPDSYDFIPYKLDYNPDFVSRSLRGNVVFRWEYRPGSTLFVVWSQSRSASPIADDPALNLYNNMKDTFTDKGENVFLVKLSYWLGI
jgi:hypothetical protein